MRKTKVICTIGPACEDERVLGEVMGLKSGDNVVLTGGVINGNTGNTNMIKVEKI